MNFSPCLPTTNNPQKFSVFETKATINNILNGIPVDAAPLLRYFRIMSRDLVWMQTHKKESRMVMKAITCLYLTTTNEKDIVKINAYVLENHLKLSRIARSDIVLEVEDVKFPCVSLFLACQSPMFERMLKGSLAEGKALREYYLAPDAHRPHVPIGGVSPYIAKQYFSLISTGALDALNPEEEQQFRDYVDMTQSFKHTFLKAEKIFLKKLTPLLADQIYTVMFEKIKREIVRLARHSTAKKIHWELVDDKIKLRIENDFISLLNKENVFSFNSCAHKRQLVSLLAECKKIISTNFK